MTEASDTLRELERILHAEIPLTRAMGVTVARLDPQGLTLGAPLAPNLNHKKTAFGGSLSTLATLAGWGLIQLLVREYGGPVTVVIQESTVQYLKPVEQDFAATALRPPAPVLEKFLATLQRRGRARLEIEARILASGQPAVAFRGQYVAYDKARHPRVAPV